jgi:hypothetical protein
MRSKQGLTFSQTSHGSRSAYARSSHLIASSLSASDAMTTLGTNGRATFLGQDVSPVGFGETVAGRLLRKAAAAAQETETTRWFYHYEWCSGRKLCSRNKAVFKEQLRVRAPPPACDTGRGMPRLPPTVRPCVARTVAISHSRLRFD